MRFFDVATLAPYADALVGAPLQRRAVCLHKTIL